MSNQAVNLLTGAVLPYTVLADAPFTITASMGRRFFISNPTAARTISINGAGFKAGEAVRLDVEGATSANEVVLQTALASIFDRISGAGHIEVRAKIDNPSAFADWAITQVEESVTFSGVPSSGAGTGGTYSLRMVRNGSPLSRIISITGQVVAGTGSPSSDIAINTIVPARFRPARTIISSTSLDTATNMIYFSQLGVAGTITASKRLFSTGISVSNFLTSEERVFNLTYNLG
jgi:hypothetical protein